MQMLRAKRLFCESRCGKGGRCANEKEFGRTGNRGSSGVNFRRWPAKGKTGVSHRRSPVPVIFPSKAARRAYSRRPGLDEKRIRGSLKQHDEARREEAEEHEEALLHREANSLHGKTKAKSSRSFPLSSVSHSVPLSFLGSILVQVLLPSLISSVSLRSLLFVSDSLSSHLFLSLSLFSLISLSRSSSLILFNSPPLSAFPSFPFDPLTSLYLASSLYRALSASLSFRRGPVHSIFHSRHRYRRKRESRERIVGDKQRGTRESEQGDGN